MNKQDIEKFYDASTPLWMETWGEHMHHGYYAATLDNENRHLEAQIEMLRQWLKKSTVDRPLRRFLDAGCGVGGSGRFLAEQFESIEGVGVTISPLQASIGQKINLAQGYADRLSIIARDMMDLSPQVEGTFDLIWCMESAEHIANKGALLSKFYSLLRPGGILLMTTWCHRPEPPQLNWLEKKVIKGMCKAYRLPQIVSIPMLVKEAAKVGYVSIEEEDWTSAVLPFWREVMKKGIQIRHWHTFWQAGLTTWRGAGGMAFLQWAHSLHLIQYGVIRAQKPM